MNSNPDVDVKQVQEQDIIRQIQNEFAIIEKSRAHTYDKVKKSYDVLITKLKKELLKVENHERQISTIESNLKKKSNAKLQELDIIMKKTTEELKLTKTLHDKRNIEVREKLSKKQMFIKKLETKINSLEQQLISLKTAKLNQTERSLNLKINDLELENHSYQIKLEQKELELLTLTKNHEDLKLSHTNLRKQHSQLKNIENNRKVNKIKKLEYELLAKNKQKELDFEKKELDKILREVNNLQNDLTNKIKPNILNK